MRPSPGAPRRHGRRPPDSGGLTRPQSRLPTEAPRREAENAPGGSKLSRRLLAHILALAALAVLAPGASAATHKRVFAPAAADSGVLVFKVRGRGSAPGQARLPRAARRAPGREGRADPGCGRGRPSQGAGCRAAWRARAAQGEDGPAGRARLVVLVADEDDLGRTACRSPSVTEGLGNFGVGRWPGACWRPYADDSPFNQRLPRRPRLDPRSDAIVRRVTGWGDARGAARRGGRHRGGLAAPDLLPGRQRSRVRDPLRRGLGHLRDRGHAGAHSRSRQGRRRDPTGT